MPKTPNEPAVALVHEGWAHLARERPLAAWASWRRSLRLDPENLAALRAIDRLTKSAELPESARREYRFRPPSGEGRRLAWDAALRQRDLSDLAVAAVAFGGLADLDPLDAEAAFNAGLCLAWLGERPDEAVERLRQSARRTAVADRDAAVEAAVLAEIVARGLDAGDPDDPAAEVNESIELRGLIEPRAVVEAIDSVARLRTLPTPVDPALDPTPGGTTVAEILDRPWPQPREGPVGLEELPRVVAVVLASAGSVRFSSGSGGMAAVACLLAEIGVEAPPLKRSPLPLALLDAAAWTLRFPDWVDEADRRRLLRENVEDYYENHWAPARQADPAGSILLEAVIRLREELSARPTTVGLHAGYPFDRLRHRLGLPPREPASIDPVEIPFMTGAELDGLDIDRLDDHDLAAACRSSLPLGEPARTARFAALLVERRSEALATLELPDVFNALVQTDPDEDRDDRIDEGTEIDDDLFEGRDRDEFDLIRARLALLRGHVDEGVDLARDVLRRPDSDWTRPGRAARFRAFALEAWGLRDGLESDDRDRLAEAAIEVAARIGDRALAGRFAREKEL